MDTWPPAQQRAVMTTRAGAVCEHGQAGLVADLHQGNHLELCSEPILMSGLGSAIPDLQFGSKFNFFSQIQ